MEFEKPSMQTVFVLGGIFALWFVKAKALDPSNVS
jgi:hypothetical protein